MFALVALTPSCLTAHVWSSYEPDWTNVVRTHAERRFESLGMLFGRANDVVASDPVLTWIHEGSASGAVARLDLVPADGAALCVPTILGSSGITILRAGLETDRISDEDGVRRSTLLEFDYCIAPGAFGRLLSPQMLTQSCMDSMCLIEPQSMHSHSDGIANLRLMMARCVGLSDAWHLDAWLVTDETFTAITARSPLEASLQASTSNLVIGRFRSQHGIRIGAMPSSIAALLANSDVQSRADGICRHASRWHAVAASRQAHEGDHHVLGPIVERVTSAVVWTRPTLSVDGGFFARLLVTPLTLACDIALGPGTLSLWQALSGDHEPIRASDARGPRSRLGGSR